MLKRLKNVIARTRRGRGNLPMASFGDCFALLAMTMLLLTSTFSFAANPWFVDTATKTGTPARWPFEGTPEHGYYTIYWFSDPGPLNAKIGNADPVNDQGQPKLDANGQPVKGAVSIVKELFKKWVDVNLKADGVIINSVALKFVWCGNLNGPPPQNPPPAGCKNNGYSDITDIKVDPNGTNGHRGKNDYQQFAVPDMANPPPTVIIFDEDGSIITDYMNGDTTAKNAVVGLGHNTPGSDTITIKTGFVILNGRMVNGISSTNDNEVPLENFKAAILHEIGHLLNLDHSQLNLDVAQNCAGNNCPQSEGITTMFPFLFQDPSAPQLSLHNDDKAAVSYLYPSQNFIANFCIIEGDIVAPDGKGIQGVNVTTKNITDSPLVDSRSWVSGALYPLSTQNGHYVFPGILPKQDYEVDFEQISQPYRDPAHPASAVGPLLGDKAPHDFPPGQVLGSGDTQTVRCSHGGDRITMPAYKLDLASATPGGSQTPPAGNAAQTTGSSKKGFCSLNKNQPFSWGTFLGFLLIFFIPLSFYKRPQ